jgi:hypothetical protein
MVNVFYLSNVEDYLQNILAGYSSNIALLLVDSTSLFIHVSLRQNSFRPWTTRISDFVSVPGFR